MLLLAQTRVVTEGIACIQAGITSSDMTGWHQQSRWTGPYHSNLLHVLVGEQEQVDEFSSAADSIARWCAAYFSHGTHGPWSGLDQSNLTSQPVLIPLRASVAVEEILYAAEPLENSLHELLQLFSSSLLMRSW